MSASDTVINASAVAELPKIPFTIDERDPLSHFLRVWLRLGWVHVLVGALLIYGPVEKLIVPAMGGYLMLSGPFGQWRPDVVALLTGFLLYPLIFAFYIWTASGIGSVFVGLVENRSFDAMNRYSAFLNRVRTSFNRRVWSFLSLTLAIALVLLIHYVLWSPSALMEIWFGFNNTPHRIFALVLIGLVSYAGMQILLRHMLVVLWLQRLLREMGNDLVIHPYHVDESGGLGCIGQYALRLSWLLGLVMIYIVAGSLLPSLQAGGTLRISLWNPTVTVGWIVYILVVPLSFLRLLLPVHIAMTAVRNRHLVVLSDQLESQLNIARQAATKDRRNLTSILKEIENVKAMRKTILEDYPTWPVSTSLRRQIGLSTIIPPTAHLLLSLALSLIAT